MTLTPQNSWLINLSLRWSLPGVVCFAPCIITATCVVCLVIHVLVCLFFCSSCGCSICSIVNVPLTLFVLVLFFFCLPLHSLSHVLVLIFTLIGCTHNTSVMVIASLLSVYCIYLLPYSQSRTILFLISGSELLMPLNNLQCALAIQVVILLRHGKA